MDDTLLVDDTRLMKNFVIRDVQVFDGFEFQPAQDVWVSDGKIVLVGNKADLSDQFTEVDGRGKWLIPGLIDMHVHLMSAGSPPWQPTLGDPDRTLSANLAMGVTTVLDMGAPIGQIADWKNETNIALPRLAYAGTMFNVEHGHPSYMIEKSVFWPLSSVFKKLLISQIDDIEDAKNAIDDHHEEGASYIKVAIDEIPIGSPIMAAKLLKGLVDYAHSKGLKVVAHIGTEEELLKGVDAGVDMFVHGPYRSEFSKSAIRKLKRAGTPVVPTSVVFDQLAKFYEGDQDYSKAEKQIFDADLLEAYMNRPDDMALDKAIIEWFDNVLKYRQTKFDTVEAMFKAGIPVYIGSDSPNVNTVSGTSVHKEMHLWKQHTALSNSAILSAATGQPGKWLEDYLGWKVGQIKRGYDADMVLLNGDISKDILQSQTIERIWISGQDVTRSAVFE